MHTLLMAWLAHPASACQCGESSVEQAYQHADVVVDAEVTARTCDQKAYLCTITVRPITWWKGAEAATLEIRTSTSSCGTSADAGQRRIFYASRTDAGHLTTSRCSGGTLTPEQVDALPGDPSWLPAVISVWLYDREVRRRLWAAGSGAPG